jgi:hypothetical protein
MSGCGSMFPRERFVRDWASPGVSLTAFLRECFGIGVGLMGAHRVPAGTFP